MRIQRGPIERWMLFALCLFSSTFSLAAEQPDLAGSWRLISYEEHRPDGSVHKLWGEHPQGRIIYTPGGRMAAQLGNPGRRNFGSPDYYGGEAGELASAFNGYRAYYGRYSIDVKAGTVTHHVENSVYPNWIGTDQRRFFRFVGDRLLLSTPPILRGGYASTYFLLWEREE